MTDEVKIAMVKALSNEQDNDVISAFLQFAAEKLRHYIDPNHQKSAEEAIAGYEDVQVDAAAWMLNKRGWDYQTSHSENGVSRTYETGDLPASILRRIGNKATVIS